MNRLEDGPDWRRRALPDRLAPTERERGVLLDRVSVIDRWLAPSRADAIIRSVELCRGAMAIAAAAPDDVVEKVYVPVLTPYPEPVIEDVCQRFLTGRLGNRVYAPTPAEIAHECRLATADALAERGRITLILDAEVYDTPSEAERAKIAAAHERFVADAASKSNPREKPPTAQQREAAERAAMAADNERAEARVAAVRARREAAEASASTDQPTTEGATDE